MIDPGLVSEGTGSHLSHPLHCDLAIGYDLDREVRVETQQGAEVVGIAFHNHDPGARCVSQVLGDRSQQIGEGGRHTGGIFSPGRAIGVITMLLAR